MLCRRRVHETQWRGYKGFRWFYKPALRPPGASRHSQTQGSSDTKEKILANRTKQDEQRAVSPKKNVNALKPFRLHRLYAVHRCGLLLQMSQGAWTVCLSSYVLRTRVHELCINGWTDRDAVRGTDSSGVKEPCIRRGSRSDEYIRCRKQWQETRRRCGLLSNYFGRCVRY